MAREYKPGDQIAELTYTGTVFQKRNTVNIFEVIEAAPIRAVRLKLIYPPDTDPKRRYTAKPGLLHDLVGPKKKDLIIKWLFEK